MMKTDDDLPLLKPDEYELLELLLTELNNFLICCRKSSDLPQVNTRNCFCPLLG